MQPAPAPLPGRSSDDDDDDGSDAVPDGLARALGRAPGPEWLGWRRRLGVVVALVGCCTVFWLARELAATPRLDAALRAGKDATLLLAPDGGPPALQGHGDHAVVGVGPAGGPARADLAAAAATRGADAAALGGLTATPLDALLLHRAPRWQVDDGARARQAAQQRGLTRWLAEGRIRLHFDDGRHADVDTPARGWAGLGLLFWPLAGLALLLSLVAVVVLLARPQLRHALFTTMCLAQAANLLFIAVETVQGHGQPAWAADVPLVLRAGLDVATAAAAVHAFALHPRRLPAAGLLGTGAWGVAALWALATAGGHLHGVWGWTQGTVLLLGAGALGVLAVSQRQRLHPYAAVMRRFGGAAFATLALLTLTVAWAGSSATAFTVNVAVAGSTAWSVFMASLLLLVPFVARSRPVLREFAMLAGITTVATSLDLLFVAIFSLGPFASLTLAVFLSVGVYAAARHWVIHHLVGSGAPSTERIFEQLYRAARELRQAPARHPALLAQLLRDLFDPLEVRRLEHGSTIARVFGSGSTLVVPLPPPPSRSGAVGSDVGPAVLVLRYARRGRRLFTHDDARLADRVVEQLRRAVAYDQAVERGRTEERLRIAQDLHDDIGARLLTLMYRAGTPELEDYIRHTLQDLKTLTRGLAAAEHRLSHAAGEWKADLSQRLLAARVQLAWSFETDRDVRLSVVQWSALTRVLRELVSNALFHARATRVDVQLRLQRRHLLLQVADDGCGRDPAAWSHGLGLGGVRKRVKVLGGSVQWLHNEPLGIVCRVDVPDFGNSG